MSKYVEFTDYSAIVKTTLEEKALSFLEEVGGEIRSQTQRLSRRDTSQTAGSYQYKVDAGGLAVHIGSDYPNAIFEEFGTGEHALNKNGRKGYWVYVKGQRGNLQTLSGSGGGRSYSLEEARKIVAIMRSKGLNAFYTKGKKPNRPLFKAFTAMKPKIQKVAETYFGGI